MTDFPTVVSMPAEIDVTNEPDVSTHLAKAIAAGARVVIADLSGTTFCDSSGVRALLVTARQAANSGAELRLVAQAGGAVRRVIGLMGVDQLLSLYPTLDAAMAPDAG